MAKKKSPLTTLEDLPDSIKSLKGFDDLVIERDGENETAHIKGVTDQTEYPGGTWKVWMILPTDNTLWLEHLDPLIVLAGLGGAAFEVEKKLVEIARFCKSEGKTWTQIGEALGMSKQAAWERFSGED
ncbi:MAG: hypothetical protein H0U92_01520 [Actinobacteria bacterium]|nr:hypothetical protein [Actinomycetota bacterium]